MVPERRSIPALQTNVMEPRIELLAEQVQAITERFANWNARWADPQILLSRVYQLIEDDEPEAAELIQHAYWMLRDRAAGISA